ncbi:GNAT family N-acetyltransferase, partial [Cutibacterium acnes]|nr:GNAT family N-acetyltransferase [Cutibacterium acnes]
MRTRVRQLDDADLSQTIEFLSRAPVANVFLLSRIRQGG